MALLDKEGQRARVYDLTVIQALADRLYKQAWQIVFTFVICSWRVNDIKNDMSDAELYELCEPVLRHRGTS